MCSLFEKEKATLFHARNESTIWPLRWLNIVITDYLCSSDLNSLQWFDGSELIEVGGISSWEDFDVTLSVPWGTSSVAQVICSQLLTVDALEERDTVDGTLETGHNISELSPSEGRGRAHVKYCTLGRRACAGVITDAVLPDPTMRYPPDVTTFLLLSSFITYEEKFLISVVVEYFCLLVRTI